MALIEGFGDCRACSKAFAYEDGVGLPDICSPKCFIVVYGRFIADLAEPKPSLIDRLRSEPKPSRRGD
jgi:hypothetical protein